MPHAENTVPATSTKPTIADAAKFETTRRLLACLANEGLVSTSVSRECNGDGTSMLWLRLSPTPAKNTEAGNKPPSLSLSLPNNDANGGVDVTIWVGLASDMKFPDLETLNDGDHDGMYSLDGNGVLDPEDLVYPVIVRRSGYAYDISLTELEMVNKIEVSPGALFKIMYPWFGDNENIQKQVVEELENSAANQECWLKIARQYPPPEINSPSIAWERAMIRGHPSHPMHRTCLAQLPLPPLNPIDISSILTPSISFISIPRSDVRLSGQFEATLAPLLAQLNIPLSPPDQDRLVTPCLTLQLPSIHQRFQNATVIYGGDLLRAHAQSSLRTVTLSEEFVKVFPYHLKFPLACKVTSAVRTITPWTTVVGPELSQLLQRLFQEISGHGDPDGGSMWVLNEIAGLVGEQDDFSEARHLSCLIREDVEIKATARGEALVVASALAERDADNEVANVVRVYKLDTAGKRKEWLRIYVRHLFAATIPLLLRYGICLESHGQNILVRLRRDASAYSALAGFAIRDLGGLRIHTPTLHSTGHTLLTALPGSSILTTDLHEVWAKAHHTLIQNHANQFVRALGLHRQGGWAIVREELQEVLGEEREMEVKGVEEFEGFLWGKRCR